MLGQLACGVFAFGQLSVGAVWAGGMLSFAPWRGPGMLSIGYFGCLRLRSAPRDLLGIEVTERRARRPSVVSAVAVVASLATLTLVFIVALRPVWRDVVDVIDQPRELR